MRLNRYEVSQALNTLNWQNIFDKYQHRDLTLSVESFIEKEVTPKLGFTVSVSTFTKRLCNIRKRANSNVSVIDLETTTHAVLSTSSRKTELTINGVETERRSYKGLKLLKLGAMPCKLKLYQNLYLL